MMSESRLGPARRLFGLVLMIGLSPEAAAQEIDLDALRKRAEELLTAGRYEAALGEAIKLEAAIKERLGTSHMNYAIALDMLARVNLEQGRYAEAEELLRRALAIEEKVLGVDHADM